VVTLGLISDTHGVLRPGVTAAFTGVDEILHAGDIGGNDVLGQLQALAPMTAVAGNMDPWGGPLGQLPDERVLQRGGHTLLLLHDMGGLHRPSGDVVARAAEAGADLVIFGHTHRPADLVVGSLRLINPGAAGHARGGNPPTVARLTLAEDRLEVRFVELD